MSVISVVVGALGEAPTRFKMFDNDIGIDNDGGNRSLLMNFKTKIKTKKRSKCVYTIRFHNSIS